VPGYQGPLVRRHDLSPELGRKLYWGVSAALRQDILEKFDLDSGDIDEAMEAAMKDAMVKDTNFVHQQIAAREPAEQVCGQDEHILIGLLRKGEIAMFLDKFTTLTKMRLTLIRRILFEPGGEGLAVACKGIGLDKSTFVSIFVWFRQGRLGDKQTDVDELTRALSFYDKTDPIAARGLMQRWQRDPEYLNALRQVEQAGNA
jgi:hypothetical protein